MNWRDKLAHAVTDYDRRQMNKRGYNVHALGIYLQAIERVASEVESGKPLRVAIITNFTDRLLDHCLKAFAEPIATREECS